MAKLTAAQLRTWTGMLYSASPNSTPSPASAGGPSPSVLPDGLNGGKCGPEAVPVNPSPRPGRKAGLKMSGISGPTSSASFPSNALSLFLGSRLREKLASVGSMEYSQTWKESATPAGRRLLVHTASGRRISDSEFTGELDGWPKTPMAGDGDGGVMEIRPGTTGKYKLRDYAQLAGWQTTTTQMSSSGRKPSGKPNLQGQAWLCGWATTRAKDGTNPAGMSTERQEAGKAPDSLHQQTKLVGWLTATRNDYKGAPYQMANGKKFLTLIGAAALAGWPTTTTRDSKTDGKDAPNRAGGPSLPGLILELFLVPTGKRVVLAPEFSLWLMGYPEEWVTAAPGAKDWLEAQAALESECSREAATPSSPPSPRSLLERLWK